MILLASGPAVDAFLRALRSCAFRGEPRLRSPLWLKPADGGKRDSGTASTTGARRAFLFRLRSSACFSAMRWTQELGSREGFASPPRVFKPLYLGLKTLKNLAVIWNSLVELIFPE